MCYMVYLKLTKYFFAGDLITSKCLKIRSDLGN